MFAYLREKITTQNALQANQNIMQPETAEPPEPDATSVEVSADIEEFHRQLLETRASAAYSDITIHVDKKAFSCHRVILASASDYFFSMFAGSFMESKVNEITLHDVDAVTFDQILNYMYTGKITITEQNVYRLLLTSEYLSLNSLEDSCIQYIENNVPILESNIVDLLIFANKLGKKSFFDTLSNYVATEFANVSRFEKFLNLPPQILKHILTHENLSTHDDSIVRFLGRWVRRDVHNRGAFLPELLTMKPLQDISVGFMATLLKNETLEADDGSASSTNHHGQCGITFNNKTGRCYLEVTIRSLPSYKTSIYTMNKWMSSKWKYEGKSIFQYHGTGHRTFGHYNQKSAVLRDHVFCLSSHRYRNESAEDCVPQFQVDVRSRSTRSTSTLCLETPSANARHYNRFFLTASDSVIYAKLNDGIDRYYVYNPDINKWFPIPATQPHTSPCTVALNDSLYVLGGKDLNDSPLLTIRYFGLAQRFEPTSGKWHSLPSMSCQHSYAAACAHDGKLYLSGGDLVSYYGRIIEVFDPVAHKWLTLAPMPLRKRCHLLVPYQHKLWAIGGDIDNLAVCVYNVKTNSWCIEESLPYLGEPDSPTDTTRIDVIDAVVRQK